jgi:EpsI family protein
MKPSNIAQAYTLSSLLVIVAAGVLATWMSWSTLIGTWLDTNRYAHGLPLAFGAAVWFVAAAQRASTSSSRPAWGAWPGLIAAAALWLVAYGGSSAIGIQLVAPLLIVLAIWLAHGWPMLRRVIAPIAFLYFALPVWELLVPALQALCIAVVQGTLHQLGIAVAIEGVVVHIAAGSFAVVEDCSGIRFLMISLAIGYLLSIVHGLSPKTAASLLAITAVLSIIGNWLRIIIVVLAGHLSDMQHYLVAKEHESLGWAIFLAVSIAVAAIGSRMAARVPEPERAAADAGRDGARSGLTATVVAVVSIGVIPLSLLYRSTLPPAELPQSRLPVLAGEFTGPHPPAVLWRPAFPSATVSEKAAYGPADGAVELFVAEYDAQVPGKELTHHSNRLADPSWMVVEAAPARDLVAGAPLRIRRYATPAGPEWLVSYFYDVGELRTTSAAAAQVAYGALSWFGPVRSRIVVAATECSSDCARARARLAAFWHAAAPALHGAPVHASRVRGL